MPSVEERIDACRATLARHGQEHLLAFWDELDAGQRQQLLDDIDAIDFDRCAPLIESHVRQRPAMDVPAELLPPPSLPAVPGQDQEAQYDRARQVGEDAIRADRVAAFVVAGGQGTRLGYDGPKGAFNITPIRNAPLFQVFAENLLGTERRYGVRPRWYIMTSSVNHEQTIACFEQNAYFGLSPDDVMFFQQRLMPAFLPDGQIALADKHCVALSPDGHGGSLRALAESGALADMKSRGIDTISYFQVDNPLTRIIDPLFIGQHLEHNSEMSSKVIPKAHDKERVGVLCLADGKVGVIEYSDLPDELATAKNPDGSRRFDAGSIAIHVIDRDFVERLTARDSNLQLPWHRADKKVAMINAQGNPITPTEPNAVKLEMFVFDAIPLAQNPLVLFTKREEEFSPVKNAESTDSPATTKRDLIRRAARWLESSGVEIPRDAEGEPAAKLEISPAYALDAEDLRERLGGDLPTVEAGSELLLT